MVTKGKIIQTSKGFGILGEFEVGNSGVFVQRILISNISKKKAQMHLDKFLRGG
jgi:arginine deiminase